MGGAMPDAIAIASAGGRAGRPVATTAGKKRRRRTNGEGAVVRRCGEISAPNDDGEPLLLLEPIPWPGKGNISRSIEATAGGGGGRQRR